MNPAAGSLAPPEATPETVSGRGPWRQALARFRRRPVGVVAAVVLLSLLLAGALAGLLAPYPAGRTLIELVGRPQPPSWEHLLGTDPLGRDFLSQTLFALRESFVASLVCAAGAAAIGLVVGVLSAYYGGAIDSGLTWLTAAVVTIPAIALLLLVTVYRTYPPTSAGWGFWLMLLLWPVVARVVRATALSLSTREFVKASQAAGATDLWIMRRHLVPNAAGPLIVAATSVIGQSVVILATVDYLGYAAEQGDKPTLSSLIADAAGSGQGGIGERPWWLFAIPVALLVTFLVCVNLAGDALDEALNPAR